MKKVTITAILALILVGAVNASGSPPFLDPILNSIGELTNRVSILEDTYVHDDQSCNPGDVVKGVDANGNVICIEDIDTDTHLTEAEVENYVTNGPIDLNAGTTLEGKNISTTEHVHAETYTDIWATFSDDGPYIWSASWVKIDDLTTTIDIPYNSDLVIMLSMTGNGQNAEIEVRLDGVVVNHKVTIQGSDQIASHAFNFFAGDIEPGTHTIEVWVNAIAIDFGDISLVVIANSAGH